MKLQDLESSSVQKSQKVFESYFEKKIDLSAINQSQALNMLQKVRSVIAEHRNSKDLHSSERNPAYLKALFMEQALQSVVEATAQELMQKDPKVQRAMKKVAAKQPLTPEEEQLVGAMAMARTEAKKKTGAKVMESEVQQAQVVLAAQDMVDRVQGMIEDITEMEYKDLPALVESIRNEVGTSEAQSYRETATTSLEGLVEALQNAKGQLESAQGILTGQEPVVPGEGEMDMDVDVDGDTADVEVDADVDVEEPESDLEASLGRARR